MSESRSSIAERFYAQLPAVHRIRDQAQGESLRALLAILEHELQAVQQDSWQLYDDWFVETCKEWVVPYVGDLLGVELVHAIEAEGFTARSYVANTLQYRRRKGTAAVLEQLARDVTGWPARAVEYFQRLGWSQHLQHVRLQAPATASLRNAEQLELSDGPFGRECHAGEVRAITSGRGRFNVPNVGIHLWRLRHYPIRRVEPRPLVDGAGLVPAGRFHFDPLGTKQPVFNSPRAETAITHLAEERDVPARLRRRALHAELARPGGSPGDGWLGQQPVLRVFRSDAGVEQEVTPPLLKICHLDVSPDDAGTDWPRPDPGEVSVDPETGRLAFSNGDVPDQVLVDYVYAFGADLGGGPYDRRETVGDRLEPLDDHHGVSRDLQAVDSERIHASLGDAIDDWNAAALSAWAAGQSLDRVLTIMDSRSYADAPNELTMAAGRCIVLPPNSRLRLLAARWPTEIDDASVGSLARRPGRVDPNGLRPHLRANVEILGLRDPSGVLSGGTLELDGLLIEGALTVLPGSLGKLALRHCTLVPGAGGLTVESTQPLAGMTVSSPFSDVESSAIASNSGLELELRRCVLDGVCVTGAVGKISIVDCIVDAGARRRVPTAAHVARLSDSPLAGVLAALAAGDSELDGPAIAAVLFEQPSAVIAWSLETQALSLAGDEADADVDTSTLLGRTRLRTLEGSESLFAEQLDVRVVQQGCLRFSYAPEHSRTPQRFRCQPDLTLEAAEAAATDLGEPFQAADAEAVRRRLRPAFTSTSYGHPAYGQLARSIADEIFTGSEDGCEMGAFHLLKQAHREANLRGALRRYLRFGLDAGLFFST